MILPSDPLVVPQPGFRSNFVGWSDPTRSDRARYRIHRHEEEEPQRKFTTLLFNIE